jgi:hypothetical protein
MGIAIRQQAACFVVVSIGFIIAVSPSMVLLQRLL